MSLSINHISKTYSNGVKALNDLTLAIPKGMFGLLGPNGAGKSSLMRTIATLQFADSGSIQFNGLDIQENPLELRKQLGYLPQEFGVYEGESADSLLDYFALLKGIIDKKTRKKRVSEVLELTNLSDVRRKKVSGYSGGMKRRFGIAQLLLNNPKLIIVDEPTAGLDPAERTRFLNVLREIGTENTVLFSTHIVADVKELCQQLAIIDQGRVMQEGTTKDLLNRMNGKVWKVNIQPDQLKDYEAHFQVLSSVYEADQVLTIRIFSEEEPQSDLEKLTKWTFTEADLGDVYFNALGKRSTHV